jgi:S-adenosylmethionine-diacylglycerol 3-amino-3-carboxypropyl transferase
MKQVNRIKDWIFRRVHGKNLVYNSCWEDPRCDRELMDFRQDSEIVMITSAGCNALEYLLDDPGKIHCVDMNFRQNALLELKKAALRHTDYSTLYQLFGKGCLPNAREVYEKELRPHLPEFAQEYWDKKIVFFNGKGPRKSFYHYGTSGIFAWMASRYIRARRGLYKNVQKLLNSTNLEDQKAFYFKVERQLLGPITEWLVNRHVVMSLVGVPRSQQELFVQEYEKGALGYIRLCLRKVFTQLPVKENYFWRLYLNGSYQPDCCPEYLNKATYPTIRERAGRVQTHTSTISNFLKEHPGPYSHFILLDHQDWLAANDREALEEEWKLILANSRPGTRILLRSAAEEVHFFPDFVKEKVIFEKEITARTHQLDRVGTYASVYLCIVQ